MYALAIGFYRKQVSRISKESKELLEYNPVDYVCVIKEYLTLQQKTP